MVAGCGFDDVIAGFSPVTLAGVEPVSLLGRFDRKFLLDEAQLLQLVAGFGSDGRVLEVNRERSTPYSTVYFDTPDRMTYRAHAQGRRNRFKVRTRHYGDPSAAMLEVKVKGLRGRTEKHRCAHPGPDPAALDQDSFAFVAAVLDEAYAVEPPADLGPSILTSFRRTTLADLTRGIRVTIDRALHVTDPALAEPVALGDGLAIVEVKSPALPSPVERLLLSAGARPQRLSKYCLGVMALHPAIPGNRWRPQLRRLLPAGD